jgi:hypothetical protein
MNLGETVLEGYKNDARRSTRLSRQIPVVITPVQSKTYHIKPNAVYPSQSPKSIYEDFPLGPVKVEVPSGVRKHILLGIEPNDSRTCLIAVYDATLGS